MMMKKLMVLTVSIVICICLTACGTTYQDAIGQTESEINESIGDGYFTTITSWGDPMECYYIVYANDTKVKYFVKWTGYQFGITPLYNADGTLQVYDEEEIATDEIP